MDRLARRTRRAAAGLLVLLALPSLALAQSEDVRIEATRLSPTVSMLTGQGGNMAVCTGDDGNFLIDDQYAPLTAKIRAAIEEIHPGEVRFVLNTHWHGDHTGGNENLGETGTLIVAHDNVRKRLASEQISTIWDRTTPPSPDAALPVITFDASVTFHLNGEEIHAFHVPPAHTDGDAIVHFRTSNVVHMGDTFFNGLYPFVDTDSGGRLDGVIGAAERVLGMIDADTHIVPGHGPLAKRADLVAYRDMLKDVRARMMALIDEGKGLPAVLAAQPTAAYDADWGGKWLDAEKFVTILYGDLAR